MKKAGIFLTLALAVSAFTGGAAFAQTTSGGPQSATTLVQLREQNGSGQNGTAQLSESNGQLVVVINVTNGSSTPQPAHIHKGTCATLDPKPAYPLTNVVDGKSETTVPITLANLANEPFAINIHKSAAEASTYVSCGDIAIMTAPLAPGGSTTGDTSTPGMPTTGAGSLDLTLPLAALFGTILVLTGLTFRVGRRKVKS